MSIKLSIGIILAIIGCISGAPSGKIVGGFPLNITQAPWQVSLQSDIGGTFQFCGGSIIGNRWILTAAHCLRGKPVSQFVVRVGATHKYNDGKLVNAKSSIIHKRYNPSRTDFDFGLIELQSELNFTNEVKPIALPDFGDTEIPAGTMCLVSGYGNTKNSSESTLILRGAEVPIVEQKSCSRAYSSRITSRMICAGFPEGGKDSCQGDSGGPLAAFDSDKTPYLIGIVSWGRGCAEPGYPGVYARVIAAREWIRDHTSI